MSRRYHQTKDEGRLVENLLKPLLETYLREELTEQPSKASLDYCGLTTGFHEIKGRDLLYRSDDKYADLGWWIGYPKVLAARATQEPVTFWYYFRSDKTLWCIPFDDTLFSSFKPFKNAQGQLTIAIPKRFWKQVVLT